MMPPRRFVSLALVLALVGALGSPASAAPAGPEAQAEVELQFGVRIPMRDSVELAATLYRPKTAQNKVPALFVKSPYVGRGYHDWAVKFARAGFAVALVDARGRGNSQGVFRPAEEDGRDGYDVVEWLARQPWCDGKVGILGASYNGFGQWATMKTRPPHLFSAVPTASVAFGVDFPMWNGITYPYTLRWLLFVAGRVNQLGLFSDDAWWQGWFGKAWRGEVSLRELDRLTGGALEVYQTWLAHPTYDEFWQAKSPSPAEYAALDLPILTITGHYDDDQPGALHYYRGHMRHGSDKARSRHHLIIGPWDHAGTVVPQPKIGGLDVGQASVLDMAELHIQWFDWTLRGGKRPALLQNRVAYYVTRAEEWRYAYDLDEIAADRLVYVLSSLGQADDAFRSGVLGSDVGTGSDVYEADPEDLRRAELDVNAGVEVPVVDRVDAQPPTGASLVYHTAVFTEPVELGGLVTLTVYLSMDVPDTDLSARLYEVQPDGHTVLLSQTVLRARHRESLSTEKLVEPGAVLRYELRDFTLFARRVAKGSRLRLVVGAPLGVSWPNNRGSGNAVADEKAGDGKKATVRLHHDADHKSTLTVGVLAKAANKDKAKGVAKKTPVSLRVGALGLREEGRELRSGSAAR